MKTTRRPRGDCPEGDSGACHVFGWIYDVEKNKPRSVWYIILRTERHRLDKYVRSKNVPDGTVDIQRKRWWYDLANNCRKLQRKMPTLSTVIIRGNDDGGPKGLGDQPVGMYSTLEGRP